MTKQQQKIIQKLRDEGWAICMFTPEELKGADPVKVENAMCEKGWDIIEVLG